MKAFLSCLLAITLVCLFAAPASTTTVVKFSDEEITDRAAVILHGVCLNKRSELSVDGKLIFTTYTFQVTELLKGDTQGKTFSFKQLGGVVGDRGLAIPGAAKYRPGEEVVAFLDRPSPRTGCRFAIGLAQGKWSVEFDEKAEKKFVSRDLSGVKIFDRATRRIQLHGTSRANRQQFDTFMDRIRGHLGR